jgi:hypothetical protein
MKAELLGIKSFGAVHVCDRNRHQFQFHFHTASIRKGNPACQLPMYLRNAIQPKEHWLLYLGSLQVIGRWKMKGRGYILELEMFFFLRKGWMHVSSYPP